MRRLLIALFCGFMLAGTAIADPIEKPVVLTPTKLYDLIEELDKSVALIKEREDLRGDKTLKALLNANKRIQELERKVAGMQKQITILHAIVKPLKKEQAK